MRIIVDPSQAKIIVDGLIKAFEYGKALGGCQPNPLTDQMDHAVYSPVSKVAQAAIEAAEENMRQAVSAFAEKEKELRRICVEGWFQACSLNLTDQDPLIAAQWLHSHAVPQDIINGVLEEIKGFREKCEMRSENA